MEASQYLYRTPVFEFRESPITHSAQFPLGHNLSVLVSEFDYHLPDQLIAKQPLADRAAAGMLHLDRARDNQINALYDYNVARIDLATATGRIREFVNQ